MKKQMTINEVITDMYSTMIKIAKVKTAKIRIYDSANEIVNITALYILEAAKNNPDKFNNLIATGDIKYYIIKVLTCNCTSIKSPYLQDKIKYSNQVSLEAIVYYSDDRDEDAKQEQNRRELACYIYDNLDSLYNDAGLSPMEVFAYKGNVAEYKINGTSLKDLFGCSRRKMYYRIKEIKETVKNTYL